WVVSPAVRIKLDSTPSRQGKCRAKAWVEFNGSPEKIEPLDYPTFLPGNPMRKGLQVEIVSLQAVSGALVGPADLGRLQCRLDDKRKRGSPNGVDDAVTETVSNIILIQLITDSVGTDSHPRRLIRVGIDSQITLRQMPRELSSIRGNRAEKSGMGNIASVVNS